MSTPDPEHEGQPAEGTSGDDARYLIDARGAILQVGERNTQNIHIYGTPNQVEAAQQKLADLVLAQWRDEISIRQLDDSEPLVVRWQSTKLEITDHPRNIHSMIGQDHAQFNGSTDHIAEMVAEFRKLTRRRLVILGNAGTGKTTLAVLLMRELLENPQSGEPVPVLLTISGWNPSTQAFHDWFAKRLADLYPPLRADAFGPDVTRALVVQRKILPILDGLDELPKPLHPKILAALNASMTNADGVILTCRTIEYATAVTDPCGDVLTSAAVIEPLNLTRQDIVTYLETCLPPHPRGSWPLLLSTLTARRRTPLTKALTTPLAVWLLRRVYIDTGADPGELLDTRRFPTHGAINDHLLDNIVQSLITARRLGRNTSDHSHPFQPSKAWNVEDAQRWLSFLAHYMNTAETRDFEWWRLPTWTNRVIDAKYVTDIAVMVFGLLFAGIYGIIFESWIGMLMGFVVGSGLIDSRGAWIKFQMEPLYGSFRLKGRIRALFKELAFGLPSGVSHGMFMAPLICVTFGLTHTVINYSRGFNFFSVFKAGLPAGIAVALTIGLMVSFLKWAALPLPDDQPQSPSVTLRGELRLVSLATAAGAIIATLGVALGFWFPVWRVALLVAAPTVWFAAWLAIVSPAYLISVFLLRVRRRVPRQLLRFLDDAWRIGLLRQVGPIYQFRHAAIQDRLARHYEAQNPRRSSWKYGG